MNNNYLKDYGPNPLIIDIENLTKLNNNFRTTLWTGENLQLTLMDIPVGESIGLEIHPDVDQIIQIVKGKGFVEIGNSKNNLDYQKIVKEGFLIIIPKGKWHNITNISNIPLKLYSIYAPPNHKKNTIHKTKKDANK